MVFPDAQPPGFNTEEGGLTGLIDPEVMDLADFAAGGVLHFISHEALEITGNFLPCGFGRGPRFVPAERGFAPVAFIFLAQIRFAFTKRPAGTAVFRITFPTGPISALVILVRTVAGIGLARMSLAPISLFFSRIDHLCN